MANTPKGFPGLKLLDRKGSSRGITVSLTNTGRIVLSFGFLDKYSLTKMKYYAFFITDNDQRLAVAFFENTKDAEERGVLKPYKIYRYEGRKPAKKLSKTSKDKSNSPKKTTAYLECKHALLEWGCKQKDNTKGPLKFEMIEDQNILYLDFGDMIESNTNKKQPG